MWPRLPGRRAFRGLFRFCPRVLFEFHLDVLCQFLAPLSAREEVVLHDARLERPLFAVDRQPPRVLGVRRIAHERCVQTTGNSDTERRGLRVRDVRVRGFVDQDAAVELISSATRGRASSATCRALDAHVADDAVAIFHKRSPTPRVDGLVLRRIGAGPVHIS